MPSVRPVAVIDLIASGFFCPEDKALFQPLVDLITRHGDEYMIAADFDGYWNAQRQVEKDYMNQEEWSRRAILNVAAMGMFSSDRTINQYATEIWGVKPLR